MDGQPFNNCWFKPMIFWNYVYFNKLRDLQWILIVLCGVFEHILGLETLNSFFSKVYQMELEHYSIQPTLCTLLVSWNEAECYNVLSPLFLKCGSDVAYLDCVDSYKVFKQHLTVRRSQMKRTEYLQRILRDEKLAYLNRNDKKWLCKWK